MSRPNLKQDDASREAKVLMPTIRQRLIQSKVVERNTKRIAYLLASSNRLYPLLYKVSNRSSLTNVYHCCTQKTASQWFRSIFHDPFFYKKTGLVSSPYIEMGLRTASFKKALPKRTVATHLYVGYPAYSTIPKPENYKTFFVMRDPRDIVVSWYFSAKNSHVLIDPVPQMRLDLEPLNLRDGLIYIINRLQEFGSFDAQRSWMNVSEEGDRIKIFYYEALAHDDKAFLQSLFEYLEITVSDAELSEFVERHTFSKLSGGRKPGEEDINSHYRKGQSGDWKNYFDNSVMSHFRQITGHLIEELGYSD